MNDRRKGWFKKAKKKFVRERVYRWSFRRPWPNREELEYHRSGRHTMEYYDRDIIFQQLEKVENLGFMKGFWKARSMAKADPKFWIFYFDKKVEE